jgi:hypothetical protein
VTCPPRGELGISAWFRRDAARRGYLAFMHAWPRLPAVVLAASAALAMAASAPPAAKDGPDEDGPRLPAAIPAGAVIPEPLVVVPVRPDV